MKVAVFAGTTEGREICEFLTSKGICFTAFTATEMGGELISAKANIHVGRLGQDEMICELNTFDLIIDATHPYATEVTENIKHACNILGKKYIRLLRDESTVSGAVYADSIDEATEFLKNTDGKIFVSTGSKEAEKYTVLDNFEERIVIRILDALEPINKCRSLGYKNIIIGKGPFSIERNLSDFKGCNWLVTKSSGTAGGFDEKIHAAKKLNINILVIKRPKEDGYSMEQVKNMINKNMITEPSEIEKKSFEIIEEKLVGRIFPEECKSVIKRVIHTTADFDYADNLIFSENAVETAVNILKNGVTIVTDTNMVLAGINKKILESLGCNAVCYMADNDVADEAKRRGVTRATVSVEKAAKLGGNVMFAIGNAPTALIALDRLIKERKIKPSFIIAAPVGFVNVVESKNLIINGVIPFIAAKGNKGGSNVAAAIVNALLYKIRR